MWNSSPGRTRSIAARYVGMREHADRAVLDEEKAFILERMSSGMWEHAMWMSGYEQFFTDMVSNHAIVHAIMSKILEIKMAYWGQALETDGRLSADRLRRR